jgi:hypothetical protein
MNKNSFGLYVFHYIGIACIGVFIGKTGMLPAAVVYILSLIAGLGGGLLLGTIFSRIPFFRWALLGIKHK